MSAPERLLITGTTGFLGSHVTHALLLEGHHVVALARGSADQSAEQRVRRILDQINPNVHRHAGRLEVIEGDISRPRLGLDAESYQQLAGSVDGIWHSAASLSFIEEHREEIFRMNIDGTRQVAELAAITRHRRLHHVSTAYVAGRRRDLALEDELDVGQAFRNPYEESKCRAESMIEAEHQAERIRATIYRPSVVIGDSVTGRATHLHGVYAFIRGLWALADRMRSRSGADVVELPLRVRGDRNATLNFVPIDYVTSAMLFIGSDPASLGGRYHMTNPDATPNHQWLAIVCDQIGIRGIEFVGEEAFEAIPMTRLEAIFHRQMAFYYQYLSGEPRFDTARTKKALEGSGITCPPVTEEFNRRMTGWYIDQLNREASGR
jgi:thioester reductase-like protein